MDLIEKEELKNIIKNYDSKNPGKTAKLLRTFWMKFESKSINVIKAELREKQETLGISVPALKKISKEISKAVQKDVDSYLPLMKILWDDYGREGRVIASIPLGTMELISPELIIPILKDMCSTCITWEDADRLAMDALEPAIRKWPEKWLNSLESWMKDDNKWVRRAAATVIARLPMKESGYTKQCLEMIETLLNDEETDVKKAVSFAIRLSARGDIGLVNKFLRKHLLLQNNLTVWVLCDAIRSMTKSFLPDLIDLIPEYEKWRDVKKMDSKDERSIESAIQTLKKANNV